MKNDPRFPTIRQTAARGPLSEHYLRLLQKQGRLPGFFVGSHYRVNYDMLLEELKEMSKETLREAE